MDESMIQEFFDNDGNLVKFVTHADYKALEEQSAYFRKEWNKAEGKIASLEEELASIKARAADYERAVTEQAMLTECVSVTGRDPSDVIRDVIQWHVSNAAQPAAAGDKWPYGVGIYGPANMKTHPVSQGDDVAANSEALGRILAYADDLTARDSRCARAAWEKELEALMSRNPFAHTAVSPAQPVEALDALQRYDNAVADYDAEINDGWDEDGRRAILRNEVANARASLVAALAHPRPTGSGCPCEPSGSDGLRCPDESGKLLCDPASDRTGEQAGEVIDWTDDDVETLRCLRDAVGKYANLKKLWVPTIEKMLARARHVENATAMPYAQPRPVGVRHEAFFAVLRERVEHFERIGKVGGKYIDGRRHEARLILDCCNEALLAAEPDGEVG